MRTAQPPPRRRGFTLLEIILAVTLMAMLMGMILFISRTALALGNTVAQTQNEAMLREAFFDLLDKRFSTLPGNTRFNLTSKDTGGQYLSELTLQKVPLSFTWGGQPRVAKAVQLVTVRNPRTRFLSIMLRYYEEEILDDPTDTARRSATPVEPFAEIELLTDVAYFEWRVLDGRSMEWGYEWDLQGRLPLQLELVMAIGAHGEEMRQIFWISPKQNPEVVLRQNLQNQGNQPGQPGQPGPGQPGQPPTITIPTQPQPQPQPPRR